MPQEAGAATMLAKRGAGVLLKRANDIVPAVRRMAEDARYYAAMRAATATMSIPHSTRRIVEEITAVIPALVLAEEERVVVDARIA